MLDSMQESSRRFENRHVVRVDFNGCVATDMTSYFGRSPFAGKATKASHVYGITVLYSLLDKITKTLHYQAYVWYTETCFVFDICNNLGSSHVLSSFFDLTWKLIDVLHRFLRLF